MSFTEISGVCITLASIAQQFNGWSSYQSNKAHFSAFFLTEVWATHWRSGWRVCSSLAEGVGLVWAEGREKIKQLLKTLG